MTIKELAALTGISKSTISRVINKEAGVKESTRRKVLDAIEQYDYHPNLIARGMISGAIPMIMAIVGDIQTPFFTQIFSGLQAVFDDKGYSLVVFDCGYDPQREIDAILRAKAGRLCGIIPMTGFQFPSVIKTLEKCDQPVVLVNCHRSHQQFDRVYGNDFETGYAATGALIAAGNKNIIYFTGDSKHSVISSEREQGYIEALQDNGIIVDRSLILQGNLKEDSGYKLAEECAKRYGYPLSICCNNYLMGLGVSSYMHMQGKIPNKDYHLAICEMPPLYYDKVEFIYAGIDCSKLGKTAAQIMLERLNGSQLPPKVQMITDIELHTAADIK